MLPKEVSRCYWTMAKNQIIIRYDGGLVFQSYDSTIAYIDKAGKVFLDKDKWDYSVTTGKYRNKFLDEQKEITKKKVASGEYTLTDLNPREWEWKGLFL